MLHPARSSIIKPPRGTPINRAHSLARGLVGCWPFNEMTGAQVFDLSGNGNHGTLTDMDTVNDWAHGGIDFDGGNDDHIVVPDADILSFTDGSSDIPFTIVSKIFARDNYRFGICSKYSVASPFNGEFSLTLDDSGNPEFQILQSSASDRIRVASQSAWPENEWHSIAARYDGSEADSGLSLFMDGSEIPTNQTGSGTYGGLINRDSDFHIGTILHEYSSGGLWVADGIIAHLFLYRRYLTDTEIASLHHRPYQIFEQSTRAKYFNVTGGTTRQFAANITGITSTPAIDMAVARELAANISGASTTSDVDLTRLMAFSAQIAGTTLTSDVDLAVARAIVAGVAAITSTADIDLAVLREISANITGASNTSDIELTLAGIITFAASIAGVSVTSDAALSVARVLSATINGTTADTAAIDLAVLRTLSANISATSITSAIDLVIAALGLIINPSLRSLTVQRSLVSKTVKRTVKSV